MTEEDTGSAIEMLNAGKRAIRFQEFLTRRSWGLFYGIWAIDILLITIGSLMLNNLESDILSTVGIVSGFFISTKVFGRTGRISTFKRYINGPSVNNSGKKIVRIFLYLIAIYVVIVAFTILEISSHKIEGYVSEISFLLLIFAASSGSFYASLKGLGKLTIENFIASVSLFLVGIIEVVILSIRDMSEATSRSILIISWTAVIDLWIISSLISLYRSSEVLGALDGEN